MPQSPPKTIYFAVLNMGLGHATRSLPVMKALQQRGHRLVIGSSGRAMAFFRQEMPDASFVVTPDYGITYSKSKLLWPRLLLQAPGVLWAVMLEKELTHQVVFTRAIDCIISDNCYGAHSKLVPSYFISHQLYFAMPRSMTLLRRTVGWVNRLPHRFYQKIFVPDIEKAGEGLISGALSEIPSKQSDRYSHIGWLASVNKNNLSEDIDVLVSISGPEPQRTFLEEKVLADIRSIPGKKVVLLGKSEEEQLLSEDSYLTVYNHLPRENMNALLNRAKIIVSRPGYTTLMELAELGRKALLIPTPGQTEQIYLAKRLMDQNLYFSVEQSKLDLARDLQKATQFPGLQRSGETQKSVERLLQITGL